MNTPAFLCEPVQVGRALVDAGYTTQRLQDMSSLEWYVLYTLLSAMPAPAPDGGCATTD